MKALSLSQPWATLIAIGAKRIETRSWRTAYRGPLAIHASKGFAPSAKALCLQSPFRETLAEAGYPSPESLPLGAILTFVAVEDVAPTAPEGEPNRFQPLPTEPEWVFGDYSPGRWMWLLRDVRPLPKPIPAKGALSLWNWEPPEEIRSLLPFFF